MMMMAMAMAMQWWWRWQWDSDGDGNGDGNGNGNAMAKAMVMAMAMASDGISNAMESVMRWWHQCDGNVTAMWLWWCWHQNEWKLWQQWWQLQLWFWMVLEMMLVTDSNRFCSCKVGSLVIYQYSIFSRIILLLLNLLLNCIDYHID